MLSLLALLTCCSGKPAFLVPARLPLQPARLRQKTATDRRTLRALPLQRPKPVGGVARFELEKIQTAPQTGPSTTQLKPIISGVWPAEPPELVNETAATAKLLPLITARRRLERTARPQTTPLLAPLKAALPRANNKACVSACLQTELAVIKLLTRRLPRLLTTPERLKPADRVLKAKRPDDKRRRNP